jgi:hypothetical protein
MSPAAKSPVPLVDTPLSPTFPNRLRSPRPREAYRRRRHWNHIDPNRKRKSVTNLVAVAFVGASFDGTSPRAPHVTKACAAEPLFVRIVESISKSRATAELGFLRCGETPNRTAAA